VASWSEALAFDLAFRHGRADGVAEDELRAGFTWAFEAWRPSGSLAYSPGRAPPAQ
jgi:hypothetical protein